MTEVLESRGKFRRMLAEHSDWDIPLAQAELAVSSEEYPGLDWDGYLRRIDNLAARVQEQLKDADPRGSIRIMNTVMFIEEGYEGDRQTPDDPRNFFINDVMDRKAGSAVLIGSLFIEVGRRAGLPLQGVGLPGNFIVRYHGYTTDLFVDPFNDGKLLTAADCHRLLERFSGYEMPYDPSALSPWDHRQLLHRILASLRRIYMSRQEYAKALWAVELMMILQPAWGDGLRERGWLHYKLKCYNRAQADLQGYLSLAQQPEDAEKIWGLLAKIREAMK